MSAEKRTVSFADRKAAFLANFAESRSIKPTSTIACESASYRHEGGRPGDKPTNRFAANAPFKLRSNET
jgi:hypothetical protein